MGFNRLRIALVTTLMACAVVAQAAGKGESGEFRFAPPRAPALTVLYHTPAQVGPDTPVVIALHGVKRDATSVLRAWAPLADAGGYIVLAPEFDRDGYRGAAAYNQGRVMKSGQVQPAADWSYAVVEQLFDAARDRWHLAATDYALFGHSAGAQFAHRATELLPQLRARLVISANAGWYTMPDPTTPWPWGLQGLGRGAADECRAFARPMVVLLGEDDNDPRHPQLNRGPEEMAQGAHRLARGENFFARSSERARELGCPFEWRIEHVPGVAHDARGMARAAQAWLAPRKP